MNWIRFCQENGEKIESAKRGRTSRGRGGKETRGCFPGFLKEERRGPGGKKRGRDDLFCVGFLWGRNYEFRASGPK